MFSVIFHQTFQLSSSRNWWRLFLKSLSNQLLITTANKNLVNFNKKKSQNENFWRYQKLFCNFGHWIARIDSKAPFKCNNCVYISYTWHGSVFIICIRFSYCHWFCRVCWLLLSHYIANCLYHIFRYYRLEYAKIV